MAADIEGIVGADNMKADAKEHVITLLHDLQQPATTKRYLYGRWARLVGLIPVKADIDRVALWSQGA